MLNQNELNAIKATVPALEKYGEEIINQFYRQLFISHPQLLNIFNQTNQKNKTQHKVLASVIHQTALHIDNLSLLMPIVEKIAQKHISVGVKPEHYQIVGTHLLSAFKEVLGESLTPSMISAWTKAYKQLADAFIKVETGINNANLSKEYAWNDFTAFKVLRKEKETHSVFSFYIAPANGKRLPTFKPGQYISVRVKIPSEKYTHIRQYSLSDSPQKEYYRITVKSEVRPEVNNSGVVSNYLHKSINAGDLIEVSMPAGYFTINAKEQTPLVLISGGIGITPMLSMLISVNELNKDRKVLFIHANVNATSYAMKSIIDKIVSENKNIKSLICYENPTTDDKYHKKGYIDFEWLNTVISSNADAVYKICGPISFMSAVVSFLKRMGIDDNSIHYEVFGPQLINGC